MIAHQLHFKKDVYLLKTNLGPVTFILT